MIPFIASKLTTQYVRLKSVTTALGGSISIVDEALSTPDKEVFKKIAIPMAIARQYMKRHAIRQYLKPVRAAMVMYDNRPVALERHPQGTLADAQPWVADSERHVKTWLKQMTNNGSKWYIDGTYLYTIDAWERRQESKPVSLSGRFQAIQASTFKLANLEHNTLLVLEDRMCLMYQAANGQRAISPPIWKSLLTIGNAQFNKSANSPTDGDDDDIEQIGVSKEFEEQYDQNDRFDRIDQMLCVNLSFIIKAGRELADVFGYDAIEPLNLPDLMLQLKTVNLPNVPNAIKQTYDSGMPFTHVAAWLIGLLRQVETMDSYLVVRSLLKHLSTKGVYRKNAFDPTRVYRQGFNSSTVPLMTAEEAEVASYQGPSNFGDFRTLNNALHTQYLEDRVDLGGEAEAMRIEGGQL